MTIVEFLLARIAEDEAVARDVLDEDGRDDVPTNHVCYCEGQAMVPVGGHRMLAECQAKRAILAEHRPEVGFIVAYRESDRLLAEAFDEERMPVQASGQVIPACLRHLAAVYAGHPDYRQEWKP